MNVRGEMLIEGAGKLWMEYFKSLLDAGDLV